jgi:hypothetical protein
VRQSGEQWVEVIDEKKHMVKEVKSDNEHVVCPRCMFSDGHGTCVYPEDDCPVRNGHYIKDLGILNEDGCLPEERTGKYPTIKDRNEYEGWRLFHIWDCIVCEKIGNDDEAIEIRVSALTRQEAIDRWNRRA